MKVREIRRAAALERRWSDSDFVQETMLKAAKNFDQFAGLSESEFLAWTNRIMRRVVLNVRRGSCTARRDVRRDVALEPALAAVAANDEMRAQHREAVLGVLHYLEPHEANVVRLRLDGLTFEAVAAALGISVEAARSRHRRAVVSLIELLRNAAPPLSVLTSIEA
jgi:RNA polymerase sigma factor (sigma-70 family)